MCVSRRAAVAALALLLGLVWVGSAAAAVKAAAGNSKPAPLQLQSGTVTRMAEWVIASGDNGGLPFAIIDKVAARIYVFRPDGQLLGKAPALIGSAKGDYSTPGDANREMSAIPLKDRTTPAGRFVASFGAAYGKQRVLWVDYATAIALHPVVAAHPKERRLPRLKSRTPRDNHITHGCINVSADFYTKVVRPTFIRTRGIVYILPETRSVEEVFPTFRPATRIARNAEDSPGVSGPASRAGSTVALGK